MTRARRRVVRLALMLQVAGIEPVIAGSNYGEMLANLELQWSGLTSSRRKAVRRQALRLISEARGLENAADQLIPRPPQPASTGRRTPIQPCLRQMPPSPPETPRCSVCRTRFGVAKRSFASHATARKLCEMQKDPLLVVYACPAGAGWHLGHPAATPPRQMAQSVDAQIGPMVLKTLQKESPMKMHVILGNPFLIVIYSASLLLIGRALGIHWAHTPETALWLSLAGGLLMAAHDSATAILWFWLTARWAHSVIERNKDRG